MKNQIFVNENHTSDYVTTNSGHIFLKKDNKREKNIPEKVSLDDVSDDEEVQYYLTQNTLIVDGDEMEEKEKGTVINSKVESKKEKSKGIKEKATKKTIEDNEEIIDEITKEDD